MKKLVYFTKSVVWFALICYGLFIPANELPVKPFINIPYFDKMVHFSLFFIFCLLLFKPFKKLKLNAFFWAPGTAVFLGALLESTQRMLSHTRSSDFYDFLTNAAGIAASVIFYRIFVFNKKWEFLF
ncbi:MAG: VanZ family protein [Prolixibacteraceae bacterium]|nr:VanZ family protein [Prolixibacteraceae bacterium]